MISVCCIWKINNKFEGGGGGGGEYRTGMTMAQEKE